MDEKEAACFSLAEIAARAAADQLRTGASRGQEKSPAAVAGVGVEAWKSALAMAPGDDARDARAVVFVRPW